MFLSNWRKALLLITAFSTILFPAQKPGKPVITAQADSTSFFNPNGNVQQVFYIGVNQHVYQFYWRSGVGWSPEDVTVDAVVPPAAPGSSLTSFFNPTGNYQQVFFEGADQRVYSMYFTPSTGKWFGQDLMKETSSPLAAPGSALTSFFNPSVNAQQVFYIGTDLHVHQVYWTPNVGWSPEDVTVDAGAPPAMPGSALTSFFNPAGNYQQVFYEGADQHIYSMYFSPGPARWYPEDVTAAANSPLAAPGSALTSFFNPTGNYQQVFYEGSDQHVHSVFFSPNTNLWYPDDLTNDTNSPPAAPGAALTSFFNSSLNAQQVFYIATDKHVHQFYWQSGVGWSPEDVTGDAGAPAAVSGSPLTGFFNPAGNYQQVFFNGADQHVYSMYFSPSSVRWFPQDLTAATNAPLAEPPYVTINGQVLAGSAGFSGATVNLTGTTKNGVSISPSTAITDVNGNSSFSVAIGGIYTLTPVSANYTFSPASQSISNISGNQTLSFVITSAITTEVGTPVPQPPPTPAPAPAPPSAVSGSVTNCNDISGQWTDEGSDTFSLSQIGNSVTGTTTQMDPFCGNVTWTITGQSTGPGTFSLTETNPVPAIDACGEIVSSGETANVTITGCSTAQSTYTGNSSGGSGFTGGGGSGGSGPTFTWTRSSAPPGLQVTVDIMNDKVSTNLTGSNKRGTLSVAIKGPSQTELAEHSSSTAGQSFDDSLTRTTLSAGQYGSVVATWDNTSVTVPVSFYVIGYTRFSQYNFPYETQCSANPQPAWIIYQIDKGPAHSCHYKPASLGSMFITQTITNGTGVSMANGILKAYGAGATKVCSPAPGGSSDNTFFAVDSGGNAINQVIGAFNSVLSDGTGLANPLTNNNPRLGSLAVKPGNTNPVFAKSDQILMIDQNNNYDLRSVQDLCPKCADPKEQGAPKWPGTVAHIDVFNSSQTCNPNALGDYGSRVAIKLQ